MILGGRVLGLIPARGGSKGVPRKNLHFLGGKPLLQWTAEAALASKLLDRVVLSTEDDEIAAAAQRIGLDVPFRRTQSAATDQATPDAVIEDALEHLGSDFEYLVWLQPTSPFRSSADIDACLQRIADGSADACVSVTASRAKVEWLFFLGPNDRLDPVAGTAPPDRRQELRPAFVLNGAVYAMRIEAYRRSHTFISDRTVAWVMPPERSIDLDEQADFDLAERMLMPNAGAAG